MTVINDLTDRTFGELRVITRGASDRYGRAQWLCGCSCGRTKVLRGKDLLQGKIKSCGCFRAAKAVAKNTTHGHCTQGRSPTYEVWCGMWARCSNPKTKHYKYYGGRGITVCEEWMRFEQFLADMGERPLHMTLDRKDVNGNYEPGNCRWVTWDVQVENKRRARRKEYVD